MKAHLFTAITASISAVSALAAWQEQLDWGLRIIASLMATVAGAMAVHDWLKRRAEKRAAVRRARF